MRKKVLEYYMLLLNTLCMNNYVAS